VHLFDSLIQRYASTLPHEYEVSIKYHNKEKKKLIPYEEKYVINFGDWYGSNLLSVYSVHDAVKSLQEIHKVMKSWTERMA
jgi:hypothetical protein